MKIKKRGLSLIFPAAILLIPFLGAWPQTGEFPRLLGPYLGQKPPGTTPEMFAPGIVSTCLGELNSVFSPDGTELYFCVRNQAASTLFVMKSVQGAWGRPEPLPFSGLYNDIDVSLSPDGQMLYFCSNRPASGSGAPKRDYDIWMCARKGGSWGSPERLGDEVNSSSEDFFPIVTKSRTIYFNSQRGGPGTNDIYSCHWVDGKYAPAEKLGPEINSEFREFDAFVSPDEDFVIFTSERPDGDRFGDLYISSKDAAGKWTPARNMGKGINSLGPEYGTGLTPDGKYLLFTRMALAPMERPSGKALTIEDYLKMHNSPDNGSTNIWWVDARIISKAEPRPLNVLVLLGEWFGDAYFPLKEEIEARGWTMKRVGLDGEYRGCYNKKRDVVLRSDIVIQDKMDLSGFDALIIPSGPQFRKFRENPSVFKFVRDAHASGLLIASFCVANNTVKDAGLIDFPNGPALFPEKVTLVKERILLGPRGGGPPPGDGFESAPIKEICDAIVRELGKR